MARKKPYSESIINAGLQIIKKDGIDSLNARHLAEEMGTTTTPIFTNFGSMDNLLTAIWSKANEECDAYLLKSLDYPMVFKEFGMRFLSLAIENPNIYKLVFLMPFSNEQLKEIQREKFNKVFKPVLDAISNPYNLNEDGISELIHILITFTSGLAVTHVIGKNKPDKAAYGIMLTHLFDAACEYIAKHQDSVSPEAFKELLNKSLIPSEATEQKVT